MFYVQTDRDVKIAVYDLNPAGRETVLLVHGWPLSHKIFEYQTGALLQRGLRVVSIDLRGFGKSDAPALGYGYDRMADDIRAVVRHLNLRNFTLVGFSMGGGIAARYMGRHNGYGVKRLVFLAAAAPRLTRCPDFPRGVPPEAVDGWIAQASADRPRLAAQFGEMLFANPHSMELADWFGTIALEADGLATVQAARALRDEDCRADLAKIHVPTAIFHSAQDQVVPFELAQAQQQCIPGSVLYRFEQSGHGIFYDELAEFNPRFVDFVAGSC